MEFSEFILTHDGDDLSRLALTRERFQADVPSFDVALTTLEARRGLQGKVPEWHAIPSLEYPLRLSAEQCSSSETARYKASVAACACAGTRAISNQSRMAQNDRFDFTREVKSCKKWQKCEISHALRLADLTGGLGVDSWAFSQVFAEVLYNEMNPLLADAARHNFPLLGARNITVSNARLQSPVSEVLGDFHPDIIYLDPARRASDGRKVFRLEDCQPDVLQLLPELLEACPLLLLKLSPMADITLVCKQLSNVREVHAVAAEGECKELLMFLERGYSGPYTLTVYESGAIAEISGQGSPVFASEEDLHGWLFEPGKALLKAGAFDWPSSAFGLRKLGRHTHLFVSEKPIPADLAPFGKCFEIKQVLPFGKAGFKAMAKAYPKADTSARNIPITSEALGKKLGVRPGGPVHIFGIHLDVTGTNYLLSAVRC